MLDGPTKIRGILGLWRRSTNIAKRLYQNLRFPSKKKKPNFLFILNNNLSPSASRSEPTSQTQHLSKLEKSFPIALFQSRKGRFWKGGSGVVSSCITRLVRMAGLKRKIPSKELDRYVIKNGVIWHCKEGMGAGSVANASTIKIPRFFPNIMVYYRLPQIAFTFICIWTFSLCLQNHRRSKWILCRRKSQKTDCWPRGANVTFWVHQPCSCLVLVLIKLCAMCVSAVGHRDLGLLLGPGEIWSPEWRCRLHHLHSGVGCVLSKNRLNPIIDNHHPFQSEKDNAFQ